jgi:hypothetical protein
MFYADSYSHTTGKMYVANCRIHRMSETNLIVDGAITADKLTANHLNAVNTESGTFQQAYTAPGDDNTTPGAGLKITGGNIEAYGATQTFGGPLIASDGNYMASIGKYLTTTGKGKRYPLNNGTNFTADGKVHLYVWFSNAWRDVYGEEIQYTYTRTGSSQETLWSESIPTDETWFYEYTLIGIMQEINYGAAMIVRGWAYGQNDGGTLTVGYSNQFALGNITSETYPSWDASGTSIRCRIYNSSGYDVKYQLRVIRTVATAA